MLLRFVVGRPDRERVHRLVRDRHGCRVAHRSSGSWPRVERRRSRRRVKQRPRPKADPCPNRTSIIARLAGKGEPGRSVSTLRRDESGRHRCFRPRRGRVGVGGCFVFRPDSNDGTSGSRSDYASPARRRSAVDSAQADRGARDSPATIPIIKFYPGTVRIGRALPEGREGSSTPPPDAGRGREDVPAQRGLYYDGLQYAYQFLTSRATPSRSSGRRRRDREPRQCRGRGEGARRTGCALRPFE